MTALPLVSGQSYGGQFQGNGGAAVGFTQHQLYLVPLAVPLSTNFDQLNCRHTSAGTCNIRMGIYGPFTGTFDGLPRLVDSGSLPCSGAAVITAAISITLAPGWYLLAFIEDATDVFNSVPSSADWNLFGSDQSPASGYENQATYAIGSLSLPATLSGNPAITAGSRPIIRIRVA